MIDLNPENPTPASNEILPSAEHQAEGNLLDLGSVIKSGELIDFASIRTERVLQNESDEKMAITLQQQAIERAQEFLKKRIGVLEAHIKRRKGDRKRGEDELKHKFQEAKKDTKVNQAIEADSEQKIIDIRGRCVKRLQAHLWMLNDRIASDNKRIITTQGKLVAITQSPSSSLSKPSPVEATVYAFPGMTGTE